MVLGERLRSCRSWMKRCRSGVMTNSERVKRRDSCGKYGTESADAQIVNIGIIVTGGPGEMGRKEGCGTRQEGQSAASAAGVVSEDNGDIDSEEILDMLLW
jgi:hypothetical protein